MDSHISLAAFRYQVGAYGPNHCGCVAAHRIPGEPLVPVPSGFAADAYMPDACNSGDMVDGFAVAHRHLQHKSVMRRLVFTGSGHSVAPDVDATFAVDDTSEPRTFDFCHAPSIALFRERWHEFKFGGATSGAPFPSVVVVFRPA